MNYRKATTMKPKELVAAAKTLYGDTGWAQQLADALRVDRSSVSRWVNGQVMIPGPVEVAVELLLEKKR